MSEEIHRTQSNLLATEIAARIRAAREGAGMTQSSLAKHVSVARTAVTQWESALTTPSYAVMAEVGAVLGVDPRDLAFGPKA